MNNATRRALEGYVKASNYCQALPAPLNSPDTPLGSAFPGWAHVLSESIARIHRASTELSSNRRRGAVQERHAIRNTLREELLLPLYRIAKAHRNTYPGMPPIAAVPEKAASRETLLHAARAIARDVAPHRELFIADGMPEDFLDRLQAQIEAVDRQSDEIYTARKARALATKEMADAMQQANTALAHLDVLIDLACRQLPNGGPVAWTAWTVMRRRPRAPHRHTMLGTIPSWMTPSVPSKDEAPVTTVPTTPEVVLPKAA